MDSARVELKEVVSCDLFKLADSKSYPINPGVGLWCFFEAFRLEGIFSVLGKERDCEMITTRRNGQRLYFLHESFGYDQIVNGWGCGVFSSIDAYSDSITRFYEHMDCNIHEEKQKKVWRLSRGWHEKRVKKRFQENLLDYFFKFQENVLVSVSGNVSNLHYPKIFDEILEDFDREEYLSLRANARFDRDSKLDYMQMQDVFWGKYLARLSEEKEYPLEHGGLDWKDQLVSKGSDALKAGKKIKWKKLEKLLLPKKKF